MSRKRITALFFVLGLMVLSAVVGWLAASNIISPAEAAARTAPPTPSPILVPVEERVLTSDIVTRGTARYGLPQSVALIPSVLKTKTGVITTLPLPNTQVAEGDVLLAASGRPVFVLQGEVRTYRDLTPGLSGEDVKQLERALKRLGFDPGPLDGKFDEQTSAAVKAWYSAAGWEPFGPTPEQLAAIRTLEQDLAVAKSQKAGAADTVAAGATAMHAARVNAESAITAASAEVGVRTRAKERVWADPESSPEDRANAAAALAAAIAAETAAREALDAAVTAAAVSANNGVRDGKLADERIAQVTADLEVARLRTGIQVPADEIVFVPSLPVRVGQVTAVVGDPAGGPVLAVTDNRLVIDASLALDEAPLVKDGLPVTIDEPSLGIKAQGVVSRVADTPGTFGVDGFHIYLEVAVTEAPSSLAGFSLRLTIPVQSTGTAATVVPISALFLAADGSSRVQVDRDGSLEFVTVEPGLSANGYVAVKALEGELKPGQLVMVGFEANQ